MFGCLFVATYLCVTKRKDMKFKSPEQNIISVLKGKKVLFLENDSSLSDYGGQTEFERILKSNGIEYRCLFNLSEAYTMEQIVKEITEHDCICFMTQWVYDISHQLKDFMFSFKNPKIVIEICIGDPSWYRKPKGIAHDVYFYSCMITWGVADKETEQFYKLRPKKAYWDYKNNFDN